MSSSILSRNKTGTPAHDVVQVTPTLAASWIARNHHNRNIRQTVVDQYARDMVQGNWIFNGDPIRFADDKSGTLLDGQHRLHAIVASGMTLPMLVIWGLPEQTQETMDLGARRTMADALSLTGESKSTQIAAVLRIVISYEQGYQWSKNYKPTHAEMRAYLEEHPEVRWAADVANQAKQYVPTQPSAIGAAYHICAQIHRPAANLFFRDQLIEQLNLSREDPAKVLFKRFAQERERRTRMEQQDILRYTFLAWNAFRAGRKIQKLQAPRGGWKAENFPYPR